MFNFYLYNKSYEKANSLQIQENLRELNDLVFTERAEEDFFWKNDSIWSCNTVDGNFYEVIFSKISDEQLKRQVLPRLFSAITSIPQEFVSLEDFDKYYKIYNAFYGIVFDDPDSERYITNKETYSSFKKKCLWDITPKSLWERKEILFSRLILCPGVEDNLGKIGLKYLSIIVNRLVTLDNYAANEWLNGEFSYKKVISSTSLDISLESDRTMKRYGNERLFKMPDGTTKRFELHIKTGDLRIYFYPENYKIYIGYIGKHLSTIKYK
jgi:hypothetical protein